MCSFRIIVTPSVCVGKQYAENVGRNILIPVTVRAVRIFPSKEKHRGVVVTLSSNLHNVFLPSILTHRNVGLTIICIVIQWDKYAKGEEGGGGGGEGEGGPKGRDWHTAQLAQTHCPLHPN